MSAEQGTKLGALDGLLVRPDPEKGTAAERDQYVTDLVGLAQLAERAERYDDMCSYLTELVQFRKGSLNENQRNLLSVAFKNVVGALRSSWRHFQKAEDAENPHQQEYRDIIEGQLKKKCMEVLDLLKNILLPTMDKDTGVSKEHKVFYSKMAGDYYRYLAELDEDKESESSKAAEKHYQKALEEAQEGLPETHPTRLGLALNFSVCYYEILKDRQKACDLAKAAFDQAIQKLDTLNDNNYKDSTLIMQLLRDNLTLWTSEEDGSQED